jgi:hypothetical protein
MAFELHAYAITPEGTIPVKHIFYGETKEETDRHFRDHVKGCPYFGPAEKEGRMITYFQEVDELPTEQSAELEAEEMSAIEEVVEADEDEEEDDD